MTVLQFILFLYHNQPDFAAQCASPEFLCALAATLFTYKAPSEGNSDAGTPVEEIKVRYIASPATASLSSATFLLLICRLITIYYYLSLSIAICIYLSLSVAIFIYWLI